MWPKFVLKVYVAVSIGMFMFGFVGAIVSAL